MRPTGRLLQAAGRVDGNAQRPAQRRLVFRWRHTKKIILRSQMCKKKPPELLRGLEIKDIKAAQSQVGFQTWDVIMRRGQETAAAPALELRRGGCWVILSFMQEPVRVSRSGGTVSMSVGGEQKKDSWFAWSLCMRWTMCPRVLLVRRLRPRRTYRRW